MAVVEGPSSSPLVGKWICYYVRSSPTDRTAGGQRDGRADGRPFLYVRNRDGLSKLQVSLERRRRAVVEGRGD